MHRGLSRPSCTLLAVLAVIALGGDTALAAQPATGKFHWQVCSRLGSGPCSVVASISFKVTKKKGHPAAITGFVYNAGFTCGEVPIGASIKVNGKGNFKFNGQSTSRQIPITVSGKFVSSKKAVGSLVIHASCQTSAPVNFTAKHEK